MLLDDTYIAAKHLQRAGQWDLALSLIGQDAPPELRAEIVADRFLWQMTPIEPAVINAASPDLARILWARISYWHKLFKLDGGPSDVDEAAVLSAAPGGWAAFWHGVVQDNLHENADLAKAEYERALTLAPDDRMLESYAIRHLGFHLLDTDPEAGIEALRRSMNLRASLGARPQLAAAQIGLARALGDDNPESAQLRALGLATATELSLGWLLRD